MTCLTWVGPQSIGRHTTSSMSNTGASCSGRRIAQQLPSALITQAVRVIGASPLVTMEWRYDSSEPPLYPDCGADDTLPVVTILVKRKTEVAERLRVDLLRSLGGQVHVFYRCSL